MRKLCAATTMAALIAVPAIANAASTAPLAAGKPAGVSKAQLLEGDMGLVLVGAVVVGVAIAAATSQNSSPTVGINGVTPPTST